MGPWHAQRDLAAAECLARDTAAAIDRSFHLVLQRNDESVPQYGIFEGASACAL